MIKYLLILLLITGSVSAQQLPGSFLSPNPGARGVTYNGLKALRELYLPQYDTTFTPSWEGAVVYRMDDKTPYIYRGGKWQIMGGFYSDSAARAANFAGVLYVSRFPGNARQKIEAAIDSALKTRNVVSFGGAMLDITGLGAVQINKNVDGGDRRVLYLQGDGGGIVKTDTGYVFDTDSTDVGDISASQIRFVSSSGAGTKVWNCNRLIRINSINNEYFNVDCIANAQTRYLQTCYFMNDHVVGGSGFAFLFRESFDVVFDKILFENRGAGGCIGNNDSLSIQVNRSLRITNCLFENLTGTAIQLGACHGSMIANNYMEGNGGYLDLATRSGSGYQNGLVILNNMFSLRTAQISAGNSAIQLANVINQGTFGSGNEASIPCLVMGNVTSGKMFTKTGSGSFISIGNVQTLLADMVNGEIVLSGLNRVGTANSFRRTGILTAVKYVDSSAILLSGETKTFVIPISFGQFYSPLKDEDGVSVYLDEADKIVLLSYKPVAVSVNVAELHITLLNTDVSTKKAHIIISTIKAYD